MTPDEREQLLELAEQIVLNLRSRLATMVDRNVSVPESDAAAVYKRLHHRENAPVLLKEDKPHDQI